MYINVRKTGTHADVNIELDDGTKIDLGMMDRNERMQLKSDLIHAANTIERMFNRDSVLNKALDVASEIASGGIS